ncbi:hypothetical protein ACH61_03140 [Rathayibacter tanaceti]|uniref:Uncharacterized protein n=1 Tax=Rathayibacter tanaceti TaxID=1671680 RepID=A0A166H1F2_9MICO|nr:hypothetical protein ACH61_03140 [Rathayibacter tanaceti]
MPAEVTTAIGRCLSRWETPATTVRSTPTVGAGRACIARPSEPTTPISASAAIASIATRAPPRPAARPTIAGPLIEATVYESESCA